MKIEGKHSFDAPREAVWQMVLDPEVLAKVLPGCEDFERVGDNEFKGTLKIKVGPVQGKFKGSVVLSDLVEPESYQLHVKGKGAPGFVDGKGELRLDADGDQTVLSYDVNAKVGGRIATVGQRLLDSSSKVISRQALEGLEQQINARLNVDSAEAEAEAAAEALRVAEAEAAAEKAKAAKATKAKATKTTKAATTSTKTAKTKAAKTKAALTKTASATTSTKTAKAKTKAQIAAEADELAAQLRRAESRAKLAEVRAEAAEARVRAAEARATAENIQPPSQGRFAARFAQEMFEEMVPEQQRPTVLAAAGAALLALVLLLFKGC